MRIITDLNNGQTLPLRLGETLQIQLAENATTGYRWAIDRYDDTRLRAFATEALYNTDALGSGGEIRFNFQSTEVGTADIHLKYWRHWEGERSITRRFWIGLTISAADNLT